jgi:hypothetical protein
MRWLDVRAGTAAAVAAALLGTLVFGAQAAWAQDHRNGFGLQVGGIWFSDFNASLNAAISNSFQTGSPGDLVLRLVNRSPQGVQRLQAH